MDAEVDRLLGWWVTNREGLRKHLGGPDCTRMRLDVSSNVIVCFGPAGGVISTRPLIRDNEPCVCGSGRKWRKCCQQAFENEG